MPRARACVCASQVMGVQVAQHVLPAPGLLGVVLLPAPPVGPTRTPASLLHPAQPSASVQQARVVWAARHVQWGPIPWVALRQIALLVDPSRQLQDLTQRALMPVVCMGNMWGSLPAHAAIFLTRHSVCCKAWQYNCHSALGPSGLLLVMANSKNIACMYCTP